MYVFLFLFLFFCISLWYFYQNFIVSINLIYCKETGGDFWGRSFFKLTFLEIRKWKYQWTCSGAIHFFFAFWTIDWFYQLWIFKHLFKTHICILVKKVLIVFNRENLYLCLLYAWFFVPVMIYLQYAFLKRHQTLINENRKLWSSMKKEISEIYRQLLWMISKHNILLCTKNELNPLGHIY